MAISSVDDGSPESNVTERIVIAHNLFVGIDGARWNGAGRAFQVTRGGATGNDLLIAHNTALLQGNAAMAIGDSTPVFAGAVIRNNLLERGMYGVFGSGEGEGTRALDHYLPGYVFVGNALFGDATVGGSYPAGNFFAADAVAVGFVDAASGNYALSPTSMYVRAATDGGPIGADVAEVVRVTARVR